MVVEKKGSTTEQEKRARFRSDAKCWQAVMRRDKNADGFFLFAVKTTGVYCRPSCPSRRALRENVRFHATAADAERAGFRPCKRCLPNAASIVEQRGSAVAKACELIEASIETPGLATLARAAGMSASHFHRSFKALIGMTPKAYADASRAQRMRDELAQNRSVTAALYTAGFNSSGRFYATSSKVLGMAPKKYREGGKGAAIRFTVAACSLGSILVAASDRGICSIALGDEPSAMVEALRDRFPHAKLAGDDARFRKWIATVVRFVERPSVEFSLPLHIQGTAFQRRVWDMLCRIPPGETVTYTEIARRLNIPKAVRAVANACAANEIAVAVPCHRVVRTDGSLSGYRWGVERKAELLKRERRVNGRG